MDAEPNNVVIVGAGQAGAWVAITLRDLDPDRQITLIGDEPHLPYERPPLSKAVLSGRASLDSAFIKPQSYYDDKDIELVLGASVARIDRSSRRLTLSDGRQLSYGVLVLATGARARTLPFGADLPQVLTLRSADDAKAIQAHLQPGKRFVAIGAGFIGLEIAAAAASAGCRVTVLDAASQPLGRVVDKEVAETIAARHRANGVVFVLSCRITNISPAGDHAQIELADCPPIAADVIVIGVGSVPNTELARQASLECDDGVVVDDKGRTSDPHIYAVGDVTSHFNPMLGRRLRLECWQNAQNQGQAVARIIAGGDEPYAEIPWFWTDQFDVNFQMAGAPVEWDRVVWRGQPDSGKFSAFYLRGDRVVAGNTFNNARDMRFIKKLIAQATPVADAVLADPTQNLAHIFKDHQA